MSLPELDPRLCVGSSLGSARFHESWEGVRSRVLPGRGVRPTRHYSGVGLRGQRRQGGPRPGPEPRSTVGVPRERRAGHGRATPVTVDGRERRRRSQAPGACPPGTLLARRQRE